MKKEISWGMAFAVASMLATFTPMAMAQTAQQPMPPTGQGRMVQGSGGSMVQAFNPQQGGQQMGGSMGQSNGGGGSISPMGPGGIQRPGVGGDQQGSGQSMGGPMGGDNPMFTALGDLNSILDDGSLTSICGSSTGGDCFTKLSTGAKRGSKTYKALTAELNSLEQGGDIDSAQMVLNLIRTIPSAGALNGLLAAADAEEAGDPEAATAALAGITTKKGTAFDGMVRGIRNQVEMTSSEITNRTTQDDQRANNQKEMFAKQAVGGPMDQGPSGQYGPTGSQYAPGDPRSSSQGMMPSQGSMGQQNGPMGMQGGMQQGQGQMGGMQNGMGSGMMGGRPNGMAGNSMGMQMPQTHDAFMAKAKEMGGANFDAAAAERGFTQMQGMNANGGMMQGGQNNGPMGGQGMMPQGNSPSQSNGMGGSPTGMMPSPQGGMMNGQQGMTDAQRQMMMNGSGMNGQMGAPMGGQNMPNGQGMMPPQNGGSMPQGGMQPPMNGGGGMPPMGGSMPTGGGQQMPPPTHASVSDTLGWWAHAFGIGRR